MSCDRLSGQPRQHKFSFMETIENSQFLNRTGCRLGLGIEIQRY